MEPVKSKTTDDLVTLLHHVRNFLEPLWVECRTEKGEELAKGSALSADMCRFSAYFLMLVLTESTGEEWIVVGGNPEPGVDTKKDSPPGVGGLIATDGTWHGHYWVVDGCWDRLVDLTADQFGHERVILSDTDDGRYNDNYAEWAVEDQLQFVRDRAERWLIQWERYQVEHGLLNTSVPVYK